MIPARDGGGMPFHPGEVMSGVYDEVDGRDEQIVREMVRERFGLKSNERITDDNTA